MKTIITAIHWTSELQAQFGDEGQVVDVPDSTGDFLASVYTHGRFVTGLRIEEESRIYDNYGSICAAYASQGKPAPSFEDIINKQGRLLVESKDVAFVIHFENDYD